MKTCTLQIKKLLLPLCLLSLLTLSGCTGAKNDSIQMGEDTSMDTTYVQRYYPIRAAFISGNKEELQRAMNMNAVDEAGVALSDDETKDKLVLESSELSLLERGLITLNAGDYKRALLFFDAAEIKMDQTEAKLDTKLDSAGQSFFAILTGSEESQNYYLRGYEKVMLYNYKALCYMLLGDRRAYNVTRKAITKQQEEWELFKTRLADLEKENDENYNKESLGYQDSRDDYTKNVAALVPNAYVNPFGDYMDAMIMEIDSLESPALRDNARIAYGKVLDNNSDCTVAKKAAKDMKRKPQPRKKLVHVLLADGFSPERQEKSININVSSLSGKANYAEATPHKSPIMGARVQVNKQQQDMASLSKLESIILRDDEDSMPFRYFMIGMALVRTGGVNLAAQQLGLGGFSSFFSDAVSTVQRPDTRSWLTLPNKILVARMYVPADSKSITIETLGAGGSVKATTNIPLAEKGPSVIYAISHDTNLHAYGNVASWINK